MKTKLLNGLEEGTKDQVKQEYDSCSHLRRRMAKLLETDVDNIHKSMREDDSHKYPSWPYKQAERIGEVKALKKLISLLE